MSELRSICTELGAVRRKAARGVAVLLLASLAAQDLAAQAAPVAETGASGLPLPRFVSLKSDRVSLRQGPGNEYPVAWVYRRVGLPVEVVQEFESWRQVRDAEGTTGWVWASSLSGRRTALVLPWEAKAATTPPAAATLRDDDSEGAQPVAQVEAGVLAAVIGCNGRWCRISVGGFRGFIEQTKLWGAYQGEVIK